MKTYLGRQHAYAAAERGSGGGAPRLRLADRREHVRVMPDEDNGLSARFGNGEQVRLIDLSRIGARFESERRILPNSSVSLRLKARDGELVVTGRVVRSLLVRLASRRLGYVVGVAFPSVLDSDFAAEAVPFDASAPLAPTERADDVSAEEALAFESTLIVAPANLMVTAQVEGSADELREVLAQAS